MQNISKNLKHITIMEKIEEYVSVQVRRLVRISLHDNGQASRRGTYIHGAHLVREEDQPPTVLRELSLVSHFRRTANRFMCSTPNSSPWRVGGQVRETFWSGRKGPGFTEPSRNWKGKDLKLEKAIEPIREAYNRLSPSRRSMFIAQVIYLLTK